MSGNRNDVLNKKETKNRLQVILRGAFSGPPTELADIPKKNGEPRKHAQQEIKASSSSSFDASAKSDAPRKKNQPS